jgi:syntaxin 16
VIEQGTLLDRIDYNVETAQLHMQKAVQNLTDAEKSQSNYLTCCIMVLGVTVVFMTLILMFKVTLLR